MSKFLEILNSLTFENELKTKNLFLEFANMDPEEHKFGVDVNLHIYQPGTEKLSHGPRVKIFKNKPGPDFSITLEDNPRVIGNWKIVVKQKELNILIENISKYRTAFIAFWNDPAMSIRKLEILMKEIDNE